MQNTDNDMTKTRAQAQFRRILDILAILNSKASDSLPEWCPKYFYCDILSSNFYSSQPWILSHDLQPRPPKGCVQTEQLPEYLILWISASCYDDSILSFLCLPLRSLFRPERHGVFIEQKFNRDTFPHFYGRLLEGFEFTKRPLKRTWARSEIFSLRLRWDSILSTSLSGLNDGVADILSCWATFDGGWI